MTWIYDGSFEGFLCAVAHSYRTKCIPEKLTGGCAESTLFDAPKQIVTDTATAEKIYRAMETKLLPDIRKRIFHVFLCDDAPMERELLIFLRMAFKSQNAAQMLSNPIVYAVEQYEKRLFSTLHKMHAFTRFEQLADGSLYARIELPRNVLPLLGRHFVKRFGAERFIIHDLKRSIAAVYDTQRLQLLNVHDYDIPDRSEDEARFQALWKRFFDTVAIEARKNLKAQRGFVPLKYRKWMSEFGEA